MITLSVDDQKEVTNLMKKMLTNIDPKGTHMTAANMDEAFRLLSDEVQIIFLDIEMPGLGGIEAADLLQKRYQKLNVVFVTGHPEYSFPAHGVHPSGFLAKPVDEQDILRELKHLRFPIEAVKSPLRVRCSPFAVFVGDKLFDFKSDRTIELFAYLVYRNGAFCTNGELLAVMWQGNTDKQGRLRQLIMDMRECLKGIGAEDVVIKKYGKVGLNIHALEIIGNISKIEHQFGWFL